MKPDIIRPAWDMRKIPGYVPVFCECGNILHVKNVPERAYENIVIACPCGFNIHTIYTPDHTQEDIEIFKRLGMKYYGQ